MAHPVTHFEINARDAKASQKFYRDLFGWGIDSSNPMGYGMVEAKAAGNGINGGIAASHDGRSWMTIYVETTDLAKSLAKAESLGGRTIMPPTDTEMVAFALFADPEGNVIGLVKSAAPAPRAQSGRKPTAKKATTKKTTARKKTAARKKTTARARSRRR